MRPSLLLPAFLVLSSVARPANQILLRYADIGDGGVATSLAADAGGNLFAVSTFPDQSGHDALRVVKTGPTGTELAKIDVPLLSMNHGPFHAATDPQGNLVIVGTLATSGSPPALFPLVKPLFPAVTSGALVMKLDAQLHGALFSTFLANASASAVAVDSSGNIYVSGSAGRDFPLTPDAFQTTPPAPPQSYTRGPSASFAFLSMIAPSGDRLVYSTYFGGNGVNCIGGSVCVGVEPQTAANALAIGADGAVVIGGVTTATNLPVTAGVLVSTCGCSNLFSTGFAAEFSFAGSAKLSWATYVPAGASGITALGPQNGLGISALAIDSAGGVIVGGLAGFNLATTSGVLQTQLSPSGEGAIGGFVARVNPLGTALSWSTYFGNPEGVAGVAVDAHGAIVITGSSLPEKLPPFAGTPLLGPAYVARVSSDATALQSLSSGPAGAAGAGVILTAAGTFASLGTSGSLWIETGSAGPSLLAVANSAGPASGLAAPMELISLYGSGIGPAQSLFGDSSTGSYSSNLGGYRVFFDGVPAPLLYAGPTQINAVVPRAGMYRDTTQVQLVTPAGTVDGPVLAVREAQPYIFLNSATGLAAAVNQNGSINSSANPAKAGEFVTIFASSGGTFPWADGLVIGKAFEPAILPVSVLATMPQASGSGTGSLYVQYAGDAPGDVAGAMQVNFRLPDTLPYISYTGVMSISLQVGSALGGSAQIAVVPQ